MRKNGIKTYQAFNKKSSAYQVGFIAEGFLRVIGALKGCDAYGWRLIN